MRNPNVMGRERQSRLERRAWAGWLTRSATALVVAVLLFFGRGGRAEAQAPINDTFDEAISVTIGFSDEVDTTEATTDAVDAQLNQSCGAPFTDASVWYEFTTDADRLVVVNVSESSYSAGVAIATGTADNLLTVSCGPEFTSFFAEAGTTYYVLAFDDQLDGGGNGGTLRISFESPTISFTINPNATFGAPTGVATVSGTYTCTDANAVRVSGTLRQAVGRTVSVEGFFNFSTDEPTCNGEPQAWSATAIPFDGKFAGGSALVLDASAAACILSEDIFACADSFQSEATAMHLRGGGGGR